MSIDEDAVIAVADLCCVYCGCRSGWGDDVHAGDDDDLGMTDDD